MTLYMSRLNYFFMLQSSPKKNHSMQIIEHGNVRKNFKKQDLHCLYLCATHGVVIVHQRKLYLLVCHCCCIESAAGDVVLGEDGKPIEGAVPPQIGEDGQPIVDGAEAAAHVPEPEVKVCRILFLIKFSIFYGHTH